MSDLSVFVQKAFSATIAQVSADKDVLLQTFSKELKATVPVLPSENDIISALVSFMLADVKLTGWQSIFGFLLNSLATTWISSKLNGILGSDWYARLQKIFSLAG